MARLPFGSLKLSPDTIAPAEGDVKYSCIYLTTSAREMCAFSVLKRMNNVIFFLLEKSFFALTDPHQQKYRMEETSLKYPWQVDGLTNQKKTKNATIQEEDYHGHRGSSRLGIFQAYLDSTFWCLHVAA